MPTQIAACDPHQVPRVARLLADLGVNPALDHASFLVNSSTNTMRFLVSAEATDYWVRLGNFAAVLAGREPKTDIGIVNDPLFWDGFTLLTDVADGA